MKFPILGFTSFISICTVASADSVQNMDQTTHYEQNTQDSYALNEESSSYDKERDVSQQGMHGHSSERSYEDTSGSENKWSFLVSADLLIYYATEQGTDYAFTFASGDRNSTAVDLGGGNLLYPKSKWQPAFKVAIGAISPCHNPLDIILEYFRFYSTSKGSATQPPGGSLWARWVQREIGDISLSTWVSSSWKLKMDLADLELGKNYNFDSIRMRSFCGFRGGYIGQEFLLMTAEVPFINRQENTSYTDSDAWCFGFRGGAEANFRLPYQFEYYVGSSGSLMASHYVVNRSESDSNLGERFSAKMPYTFVLPNIEMNMGFAWDSRTDLHQMGFRFAVGYDFMVFWSQNVMRAATINGIGGVALGIGDLSLQGVDIKASFFF